MYNFVIQNQLSMLFLIEEKEKKIGRMFYAVWKISG